MTKFILFGESGCYSDYRAGAVAVFDSSEEAEAAIEPLKEAHRAWTVAFEAWYSANPPTKAPRPVDYADSARWRKDMDAWQLVRAEWRARQTAAVGPEPPNWEDYSVVEVPHNSVFAR